MQIGSAALIAIVAPLLGSLVAGIAGKKIGRVASHRVTLTGVFISWLCSAYILQQLLTNAQHPYAANWYAWGVSGSFKFYIGVLIDRLSATMMTVVTMVSFLVHLYSIGYMHDDAGYQRFFSYMSLFTFAMLMLVSANNFLQLFFGWEGVGVVSYLLIGFWFNKDSAAEGAFKAFVVNRVGDFGFVLGIAAINVYFGTLNYHGVFSQLNMLAETTVHFIPGTQWSLMTLICILLFIGAMAKSAQIPLHVWLPASMEGPTPISALIHAATMVTAGVYMVARLSPLFELSATARSLILVIGALGGLFLGILALCETDIKRVIAFSTMSQLGYMMAANGASAYAAGIFHLVTHAYFKALLFLGAGSVIMAMHHEQDLRKMGGLRRKMPITYWTFLIGTLALTAVPPFSGFYSKEAIIEAAHQSMIPGASFAYVCLVLGSFVTAVYSFRALFLAFHGEPRDHHAYEHAKESPWVITLPLLLLAIPSVFLGGLLVASFLYQSPGFLGSAITVLPNNNVLAFMALEFHGAWVEALEAARTLPFWMVVAGLATAWYCYCFNPAFPALLQERFKILYHIIKNQYGFDAFNDRVFVKGSQRLSQFFYQVADLKMIDSWIVNGSGRGVARISSWLQRLQSGYLYHYVLVMILGVIIFMVWMLFGVWD